MKYLHAFLGAIYGTLISYVMLLILLPIALLIVLIKEFIIPQISKKPLMIPFVILAIAIVAVPFVGLLLLSPIVLGLSIGKNTAIACYNHGWRGWLAPFKFIKLVLSEQYEDKHIKNIRGLSQDEKSKIAEITISTHAIETNHVIKQDIDFHLRKRTDEGDKSIPIEISAIMTAYSMEEYKNHYDNGDILIKEQDVANIAEKNLNKYIHQTHSISWSSRFFSYFGRCRHSPCDNNFSSSKSVVLQK